MPTTANGLVYPGSGDNVDVPGDMQLLAESMEAYIAKPYIKCIKQATQSIPNLTITPVTFEGASEKEKFGITHSTSTNTERFTPTKAGLYRVTVQIHWQTSGTGDRRIYVTVNNANSEGSRQNVGANDNGMYAVVDRRVNGTTDYIDVRVRQDTGGSLSIYGEVTTPGFMTSVTIDYIRP